MGDLFHRSMKEPPIVDLHGGRDEYGPYLGSLDVNGMAMKTVPTFVLLWFLHTAVDSPWLNGIGLYPLLI